MFIFNNFREKIQLILKQIENGKANDAKIANLLELLGDHPDMIPEVTEKINIILQKGDMKACDSAILAFNKMSQNYIGLADFSVDIIASSMKKRKNESCEDILFKTLEILSKIAQKYPERMRCVIPELLICLENRSKANREMAYFTLTLLTATHHEFFKDRQKEIIRVLNGLNVDERIYACRLIKKLAENDPKIAADAYDIIDDLRLNHPDCSLRSEAGFAVDKLNDVIKVKPDKINMWSMKAIPMPEKDIICINQEISDNFAGFSELVAPDKNDLADLLEGMSLQHMIANK